MKRDESKQRIASLIAQLISVRLAAPVTPDELEWVEALHQDGDTAADGIESRRLFWEWKMGLSDQWPTPVESDFDSAAEYQNYLQAVAE